MIDELASNRADFARFLFVVVNLEDGFTAHFSLRKKSFRQVSSFLIPFLPSFTTVQRD